MNAEVDIVEKLREPYDGWAGDALCVSSEIAEEAAEMITKLRAERDAAARDMRERCAAWHDEQCYSGHCGETTADKIFRQRHNKMHEESAYNIRLLEAPAVIATSGKDAT